MAQSDDTFEGFAPAAGLGVMVLSLVEYIIDHVPDEGGEADMHMHIAFDGEHWHLTGHYDADTEQEDTDHAALT